MPRETCQICGNQVNKLNGNHFKSSKCVPTNGACRVVSLDEYYEQFPMEGSTARPIVKKKAPIAKKRRGVLDKLKGLEKIDLDQEIDVLRDEIDKLQSEVHKLCVLRDVLFNRQELVEEPPTAPLEPLKRTGGTKPSVSSAEKILHFLQYGGSSSLQRICRGAGLGQTVAQQVLNRLMGERKVKADGNKYALNQEETGGVVQL